MLNRRLRPRLGRLTATIVVAMVLGTSLAGTAAAKGVERVTAPEPFPGGWYPVPVEAEIVFDVEPEGPIGQGAYLERIVDIDCTPGVDVERPGLPRTSDTVVRVRPVGSSPTPSGTAITCTAVYERAFAVCTNLFGVVVCSGYGSFVRVGTEEASVTLKIDTTAPVNVTPHPSAMPNANGWYRTPGTVTWTGSDPLSGIYECSTDLPFGGTDTAAGSVQGGCRNNAGIGASSTFTYRFDGTAPELAPAVVASPVPLNGSAIASPNATDNLSGIDTATCDAVDTSAVGTHAVECRATDKAGNVAVESVSYTVGYAFSGFDEPVDQDGVNIAKAGRTIPLKWRVTDANGSPVTNLTGAAVRAAGVACDLGETADLLEEYTSGSSGFRNLGAGFYGFNWATPKSYAGSCKVLRIDLGDGVDRLAEFRFVK